MTPTRDTDPTERDAMHRHDHPCPHRNARPYGSPEEGYFAKCPSCGEAGPWAIGPEAAIHHLANRAHNARRRRKKAA